jgi:predicted metal-dependent hydrolase
VNKEHLLSDADLEGMTGEELLQLGVDLYNSGRYFEAHEAWEAVWMEAPNRIRAFYQGLIQVTAAFVHVTRNEYPGSVSLLEAGTSRLDVYAADTLGLDVAPFVAGAKAARQYIVALGEKRLREFDLVTVPVLRQLGPRVETERLRELEGRLGIVGG